ncbi:ATP-dependent DNA helicase PIF1-like isoform X2 [Aedes albopictus]|uniref:ATP-dependent DNA helicase n=1 Tax=Aedes albopictus TaxID=7160 RepID=A0ABM1ZCK3_AEDAL
MSDLPMDVANNLRQQLKDCKLVIVDEISMVGSTIFSRIDTRLRQITGRNESFGGLSVITVGDFLQLPPVKDSAIFLTPRHSLIKTNISPLWGEFNLYELTEVMRQKDDLSFVKALNSFARGEMTDEDIKIIKSREIEEDQVPDEAIRLYYTNANVNKYNDKKISESLASEIECNAVDTITGKLKPNQRATKIKMWRERPTKDCGGYPYTIRFKEGIKYMLTANLDVADGLVNGATGVLKYVFCNPGTEKPSIVFLKFDSINVGKKIRNQYRNFMENNRINLSWTPIPRKVYNLTTHFQKDYQMIRDQFPIVPCEALTIHKSQVKHTDMFVLILGSLVTLPVS